VPTGGRGRSVDPSPLARALSRLARHSRAIESRWRQGLEGNVRKTAQRAALEALSLKAHFRVLRSGRIDAYRLALERTGLALAEQRVPEEDALRALGLYAECCLPHLQGGGILPDEAPAFLRVVTTGQVAVLSAYAHLRDSGWRALDEGEKLRLSRDLHDDIGHNLIVMKLYLEMITRDLARPGAGDVAQKLEEAGALVAHSIASVRRLILDLGPAILDEVGLVAAVKSYAKQFTQRTGIETHVRDSPLPKLPPSHETALYRVVQGALSNVAKHAVAANVRVYIGSASPRVVVMVIEDDGVGFELTSRALESFGIRAMRDRVESLGGRFHLESPPASRGRSKGTRIEVDLPVKAGP